MNNMIRKVTKGENGAAMILAVILLLVAGLVVASLLSFMGTGFLVGPVYEGRVAELYAADAGVEEAVWKIQTQVDIPTGCSNDTSRPYSITDVNGKQVDFTITRPNNVTLTYHVVSMATGNSSGTRVEAYVAPIGGDFSGILDHVITSKADYVAKGGQTEIEPPSGEEHGPVVNYMGAWPEADDLANWFWQDVKNLTSYGSDTIDLDGANMTLGPLFRNGPLTIMNSENSPVTLTLSGTLYITGNTFIDGGGDKGTLYLDLNGNTVFVDSATIGSPYALRIGQTCTITGSGCIIAVGDIEFKPSMLASADDYVLVMSVEGKTYMQPNGEFYGTLAGSSEVDMQNGQAHWTDYHNVEGGLNFPGFAELRRVYFTIASWQVTPLPSSE